MKKAFHLIVLLLLCGLATKEQVITGTNLVNNPSFEEWGLPNICEANIPPNNWLNYTNGGSGPDEVNFSICPTTIPPIASNGNIYARCVSISAITGEGMFQNVQGFSIGKNYKLSYDFAGSNIYSGNSNIQWHLFINDIDVNQSPIFQSTQAIWATQIYNFIATDTMLKIGLRLYSVYDSIGSGAIDNMKLILQYCDTVAPNTFTPAIYIPNAFSPISYNNIFKVVTIAEFSAFKMEIYYRWYGMAFVSEDKNKGWDGTYRGKPVPAGLYLYHITATIKDTGEKIEKIGTVTLIR